MSFVCFDEINGSTSEPEENNVEDWLKEDCQKCEENEEEELPRDTIAAILDYFTDNDDTINTGDTVSDINEKNNPSNHLRGESLKKDVERVLKTLSEEGSEVLKLSFGIDNEFPMTIPQIAERLKMNRQVVKKKSRKTT